MKNKGFFRTITQNFNANDVILYPYLYMPMTHRQHFKCLNFKRLKTPDSV